MITEANAASKITGLSDTSIVSILLDRGYNMNAANQYVKDAVRGGSVALLNREIVRFNRSKQSRGKFTIIIPAETEDE